MEISLRDGTKLAIEASGASAARIAELIEELYASFVKARDHPEEPTWAEDRDSMRDAERFCLELEHQITAMMHVKSVPSSTLNLLAARELLAMLREHTMRFRSSKRGREDSESESDSDSDDESTDDSDSDDESTDESESEDDDTISEVSTPRPTPKRRQRATAVEETKEA